ncbi:GerAB/ArcD/ProY family transporter, partial [Sulfoacidibacillus ferrooxidans]|uniref:GerAB/ArcD/ProY family transporter n=1 Tax=Sulfoacidibacillus ferrooxidans TaxID=2005001 RepID=UPI001F5101B0
VMIPLFKDPSKNLIDYFFEYFGAIFGFIFSMIIFTALLLDLSTNVTFDFEQVHVLFLPTTPTAVILMFMIISMVLPAYFGIEILGRSSIMMGGLIILIILSLNVLSTTNADINNFPPILGPGLPTLLKQGILHIGFFGEFIAYLMMRPYIRSYSSYQRSFYIISAVTLVVGIIQITLLQLIFPYPTSANLLFLSVESIKLIYFGRFIQHIEAIYAIAWLIVACLRLSFMLYLLSLAA